MEVAHSHRNGDLPLKIILVLLLDVGAVFDLVNQLEDVLVVLLLHPPYLILGIAVVPGYQQNKMILVGGKSLSKVGKDLDGMKFYTKHEVPSTSRRNLEKRINKEFAKICSTHPPKKPSFETVGRDIRSPFILRNVKDSSDNKYQPAYSSVQPHVYHCRIGASQRKLPFDPIKSYESDSLCAKITRGSRTARSSSSHSLHHLDFSKQSPRKMNQEPDGDYDSELRFNNFQSATLQTKGRPFTSYTNRKELFEGASSSLVVNLRDYKQHMFRKGWNTQNVVPFHKLKGKIRMRTDKKLEERVSEIQRKGSIDMSSLSHYRSNSGYLSQTDRKPNLVKSQYHFRLCL